MPTNFFSTLMLFVLILLLSSCQKSSSPGYSVSGKNLSGTYALKRVECFDPTNLTLATNSSVLGSPVESITISGNVITKTSRDGDCEIASRGSIVFRDNFTYKYTLNSLTVSNLSCSLDYVLDALNLDSITPGSVIENISQGNLETEEGVYVNATKYIALLKSPSVPQFSVSGYSTRVCYRVFESD